MNKLIEFSSHPSASKIRFNGSTIAVYVTISDVDIVQQVDDLTHSVSAQASVAELHGFGLCLVEPAVVLGRIMRGEAASKRAV